jgi:putative FmdB family regulatory protein
MPLYDYACSDCGPFREWQSMSAAAVPVDCPACGGPAPRAHQRNEKSADEPQVRSGKQVMNSGKKRSGSGHHRHGHHGHSHAHHGRPWMVGH